MFTKPNRLHRQLKSKKKKCTHKQLNGAKQFGFMCLMNEERTKQRLKYNHQKRKKQIIYRNYDLTLVLAFHSRTLHQTNTTNKSQAIFGDKRTINSRDRQIVL